MQRNLTTMPQMPLPLRGLWPVARLEMRKRAEETMEPVQEIRRSSEAGMSQCAREEMPVGANIHRAINRYRAGVQDGRAQPRRAEDVDLAGFTETTGCPGTPPARFLPSKGKTHYVLIFGSSKFFRRTVFLFRLTIAS